VDIRRLQYFVAVAEEGNVGRAARRLRMSQPPLSQRIRELEADLGCALFERTPQGMQMTGPGEVLLAEARAVLRRLDLARERVRRAAGDQVLRVGVLGPGEAALSARVASVFARTHGDVAVRLRQGDFTDPTVGLAAGQVDVVITFAPFDETGLDVRTVREERCFAALRAADPAPATLSRADYRRETSIRLPAGADEQWRQFWQPAESAAGPLVHSLDECLHAVLWEGAQALVPEQVANGHRIPGISYRPISDQPPARLVLASRRAARSGAINAYIEAFCASFQSSSPG
jgi:DNA-binding transcriptional LysR family regulator